HPNAMPYLGADGDVLEVWVGGGQPAGGGDRLVEFGVQLAVATAQQGREGIDVGALEFAELPKFENLVDDRILSAELVRRFVVGRVSGLGSPALLQLHLAEKHCSQLRRRVD